MKILNPDYIKMPQQTPEVFTNKYLGSNILLIGTGPSTNKLLQYRSQIKDKFDVVIGVNFAMKSFEAEMDFHVIAEKSAVNCIYPDNSKVYRKDLIRVFNWKIIDKYPKDMAFVKFTRNHFDGLIDIRSYKSKAANSEGLFIGPLDRNGWSLGSITLQAMHLAGLLGCKNLYTIGADFIFSDTMDHYYDREYRDDKEKNRGPKRPMTTVMHNGKEYHTLTYFKESADYINAAINSIFSPAGIKVHSLSDGLLTAAEHVNIDDFFGGKK